VDKRSNLQAPYEKSPHVSHVSASVSPVEPSLGSNKGSRISVDKRLNKGSSVSVDKRLNAGSSVSVDKRLNAGSNLPLDKRSNLRIPYEKSPHVSHVSTNVSPVEPSLGSNKGSRISVDKRLNAGSSVSVDKRSNLQAPYEKSPHVSHVSASPSTMSNGSKNRRMPLTLQGQSERESQKSGLNPNRLIINRSGSSIATFEREQRITTLERSFLRAPSQNSYKLKDNSDGRIYIDRSGSSTATFQRDQHITTQKRTYIQAGSPSQNTYKKAGASVQKHNSDGRIIIDRSGSSTATFQRDQRIATQKRIYIQAGKKAGEQEGPKSSDGRIYIDRSGSSMATCPGSLGLPGGGGAKKWKGMAAFMEVKQAESGDTQRENEGFRTKSSFQQSNEKVDFSGQSNTQGENRGFTETFGNRMNRGFAVSAQKDDFTTSSQGGDLLDHGRMIIDRSGSSIATCPGSLGLPGPNRTKGKGMATLMTYE